MVIEMWINLKCSDQQYSLDDNWEVIPTVWDQKERANYFEFGRVDVSSVEGDWKEKLWEFGDESFEIEDREFVNSE